MNPPPAASRTLRVAHHHPGRLRMRADAFVDSVPTAESARVGLALIRGVRSVVHDPRTGSLLVEYEPRDVDANGIIERIAELSGLDVPVAEGRRRDDAALRIIGFVRRLDAIAEELTGGRLNLGVLVPGGLAAFGVYSFLKGSHARMPRWDSLVYWGYSVFIHAHAGIVRPTS